MRREREEAIRERRGARIEYRAARPDGSWRWLCSIARVVADDDGRLHLAGVEMDVTERRQSRNRLSATAPAGRTTFSRPSPTSFATAWRRSPTRSRFSTVPTDSDAADRARATIERQVDYMVRLTDDLFDVSLIGQGKLQLKPSRVDLGASSPRRSRAAAPSSIARVRR